MTTSRAVPLLVALLCVTAIGVSATTLDSTLTTDPDEEIDPDYELLPIGQDEAFDLQQQLEGDAEPSDTDETEPTPGEGDETTEPEESSEQADEESAPDGDEGGDGGSSDAGTGSGTEVGTGTGPATPDLLDRLLALLLAALRVLVPLLAILTLVALAVRYRDRLAAVLAGLLADDEPVETRADPVETWPVASPSNPVDRAWLAMARQVDPDRPAVMTPSEFAAAAVDAGLDAEGVSAITEAFERVHYGGRPPSAERERAEAGLRRLQNADGGSPADAGQGRSGGRATADGEGSGRDAAGREEVGR